MIILLLCTCQITINHLFTLSHLMLVATKSECLLAFLIFDGHTATPQTVNTDVPCEMTSEFKEDLERGLLPK